MSLSARLRHADVWGPPYILNRLAALRRRRSSAPVHILFAIADHYEPDFGQPDPGVAMERVRRWRDDYPRLVSGLRDADGRPPRHTYFYPAETYNPAHLDELAVLVEQGFGEVEIHLHHDQDTSQNTQATLERFRDALASRHGLLSAIRTAARGMRSCTATGRSTTRVPTAGTAASTTRSTFSSEPDATRT